MASPSSYREQHSQQEHLLNMQSLSNLPARRALATSYEHHLLFPPSEGYSMHFHAQSLEGAPPSFGLFANHHVGNHLVSPPGPLSPTLAISRQSMYAGVSGQPNSQLYAQKTVPMSNRRNASGAAQQTEPTAASAPQDGKTNVDTLMRTIQSKGSEPASTHPPVPRTALSGPMSGYTRPSTSSKEARGGQSSRARKKYQCQVSSCGKRFFQKTHLEIHMRAHTGFKPFVSWLEESM